MAHPDDEQPQAPDLGSALHLENSDTLDGPAGGADALDAGYVPPDRPYVLDDDGVTGAELRAGESLDDRLAREQPEEPVAGEDRAGRLVGTGTEAVDMGVDGGAASAEEAAVHEVGGGDLPVETEPPVRRTQALADPEADAEVAAADAGSPDAFGDAMADVRDDGEFADPPSTGRHALRDPAGRVDAARDPAGRLDAAVDAAGAAAPASGRDDVGPGSGL